MSDPREVELKLDLPAAAADMEASLATLGAGSGTRDTLSSVYFDTRKHTLHRNGLILRIRTSGEGVIQTVKAQDRAGVGLFDRSEWQTAVAGPAPDRKAWAKTAVGDVLNKHAALTPVFETVVERTTWTVSANSSSIEVALDRGRVVAGAATRDFAEIELELKHGRPADLFDLARRLGAAEPVRLGVLSKSERGYALLEGDQACDAFKAEPIALRRGMPAADAFRRIVQSCLRQFRRNEMLLFDRRSVEALHEARVGMRRLRSALSVFGSFVGDDTLPRLQDGLRTVSRMLGDARNIDVYLDRFVLPERERDASETGVVAFVDTVKAMREQTYDRAAAALNTPEFRGLMIDVLAWTEVGPWATDDDPTRRSLRERPIETTAAEILDQRFRKLRKAGRHLDQLEPDARHRVRIGAKKLRYAAEFFAGLTQGKGEHRRYAAFIKAMKVFQDLLGTLNDLHTGHDLTVDLVRKADLADAQEARMLFAAGHVSGEQDARVDTLLHDALRVHAAFAAQPRFWRGWAD